MILKYSREFDYLAGCFKFKHLKYKVTCLTIIDNDDNSLNNRVSACLHVHCTKKYWQTHQTWLGISSRLYFHMIRCESSDVMKRADFRSTLITLVLLYSVVGCQLPVYKQAVVPTDWLQQWIDHWLRLDKHTI